MPAETKLCRSCGHLIHGRADKKFCDDHCRANFNNRSKSGIKHVCHINYILRKNRSIIEKLMTGKKPEAFASLRMLTDLGFNFSYFTHLDKSNTGKRLKFCYEYGYHRMGPGKFRLVKSREEYPDPFE